MLDSVALENESVVRATRSSPCGGAYFPGSEANSSEKVWNERSRLRNSAYRENNLAMSGRSAVVTGVIMNGRLG